jgi:hypothetical protein
MRRLLLVTSVLLLAGVTEIAYSCTCFEEAGSVEKQVRSAAKTSEFVGLVRITKTRLEREVRDSNGRYIGLRDPSAPAPYPTEPWDALYLVATFETLHVWKGRNLKVSDVATGTGIGDCGLSFREGQLVLLYASKANYTGLRYAGSCGRTDLMRNAARDVEILNKRFRKWPLPKDLEFSHQES